MSNEGILLINIYILNTKKEDSIVHNGIVCNDLQFYGISRKDQENKQKTFIREKINIGRVKMMV